MSLSHIKDRRDPTIFGKNLNVLNADTTINGNVVVNGTINGTSSQGQDTNNTWTGTNTYSVERPQCPISSSSNNQAVNKSSMDNILANNSVITKTASWSGVNAFTQRITVPTASPTLTTQAVPGKYLIDSMYSKAFGFTINNQTWTGSNTFTNYIPTRNNDEIVSGSAVTKKYVDNSTTTLTLGNATSTTSQNPLINYNFGTTNLAHELQIIGGGGGSTSGGQECSNQFAGVSGASGSTACLFLLTYSPLAAVLLGITSNLGLFTVDVGLGGSAGIGCGDTSSAGSGTASVIYAVGSSGSGLTPTTFQILRANGGAGFIGTCGQNGTTQGGIYSNINSNMIQPYFKCNGRNGNQSGGEIYQYAGYNKYGAGAFGLQCNNGFQGYNGGYTITSYKI